LCKNSESLSKRIRIGTRGSQLALWQANYVKSQLEAHNYPVELVIIKTQGDLVQHLSLDKLEGKGFFTSELEEALGQNQIDLAVHSMKDLPTESPGQLMIGGVSERENPADWLIIRKDRMDPAGTFKLRRNAVVGTSSNRRKAQILHFRPDVTVLDIRGNVPTRLKKVENGEVDAALLAAAGLLRIQADLASYLVVRLHPREFIPAPAQGVLAYQIRRDDEEILKIVRKHLHSADTATITNVERKILRLLQGGCHLPLGAYCECDNMGYFHAWTAYASDLNEPLRHFSLSYSTVDGLAEAIVDHYMKN
jgi:hydroxymethylbilane synthase